MIFAVTEENVKILGRHYYEDDTCQLPFSGSTVAFTFHGSRLEARIKSNASVLDDNSFCYIDIYIDDSKSPLKHIALHSDDATYLLYEANTIRDVAVRIVKTSEAKYGKLGFVSFCTDTDEKPVPFAYSDRRIEFIGDSITCGYGIDGRFMIDTFSTGNENPVKAYAMLTSKALHADYHLVSWSGIGTTSCYVPPEIEEPSNEWLIQDIYPYIDSIDELTHNVARENWKQWHFGNFIPDLIVVNLGTNDASYTRNKKERVEVFYKDYLIFIQSVRESNPNSVILCTLGTMDQSLCSTVESVVNQLRTQKNDSNLYYYHLDLQAEEDGLAVDYHPTSATHQKVALNLTAEIRRIMEWN